jgi:hypothetical protein
MTAFGLLVFFAPTTIGLRCSRRATPRAARDRCYWSATLIGALFLLGAVTLIVASVARGTREVVTTVALIGLGIPVFHIVERACSRGWRRFSDAQAP